MNSVSLFHHRTFTLLKPDTYYLKPIYLLASLRRFERLTFTFGGCHSIQLSYRDAACMNLAAGLSVNHFFTKSLFTNSGNTPRVE